MLHHRVEVHLNKTSKVRYVHIPATGEVWIWHDRRIHWLLRRKTCHILKPEDDNFILYSFQMNVPNDVWCDIQRQIEQVVNSGA